MGVFALIVLGIIVLVVLIGLSSAIRIINEYERGVLFRLGRLLPLKGPGLRLIIPFGIDRLVKIDLRTVTLEVPPQEVITHDNVTIKVNAVIYFLVVDPRNAVTKVANFINATSQIAQLQRARLGRDDAGRIGQLLRCLELTLGMDDLGSLLSFGLGLLGHGALHRLRELDVFDLNGRDLDAPGLGLLVDDLLELGVNLLAVGEQLIERRLAEHAP